MKFNRLTAYKINKIILCFSSANFGHKLSKYQVNGIEAFWSFAKRILTKFNGMNSDNFILHLKECEFRYNNRDENLQKIIIKLFNKNKKC